MKLEVGKWCRTEKGTIFKIIGGNVDMWEINIDYSYLSKCENEDYNSYAYNKNNSLFEDLVVKASYNIVDILEVGDVIIDKEGHKYPINYEFETDYSGEYNSYEITIDDYITLFLKDDLSIVTHEQIEQMAYKAG